MRKDKVGRVVSDKMDKTIVVSVERLSRHPLYKRVIRLTTKFKAHDERNEARIGDTVRIVESRPLSATKRWRMVEILATAVEGADRAGRRRGGGDERGHPRRCPPRPRSRPTKPTRLGEDRRGGGGSDPATQPAQAWPTTPARG